MLEEEVKAARAELMAARKDAQEKREQLEATIKALEEKGAERDAQAVKQQEKYAEAMKAYDEIMGVLQKPGAVPGSDPNDVKGQKAATEAMNLFLRGRERDMSAEQKALAVGNEAGAGVLVNPTYTNIIIAKAIELSPIRQFARKIMIGGNEAVLVRETGHPEDTFGGEQTSVSEDTNTSFKPEKIPVHYQRARVHLTRQMIDDSAIDLEAWLSDVASRKFAQGEGAAFVTGNGVTRPEGIFVASGVTAVQSTTASSSGNFVADDVFDTEAALISTYGARAQWLMHKQTANFIRKFKDSQNRYLDMVERDAMAALAGRRAMTLNGFPLIEAVDVAQTGTANAKVGFHGDLYEFYTIVDRAGMILIRDPYTSKATGLVENLLERRVGGQVVQPDAGIILTGKA